MQFKTPVGLTVPSGCHGGTPNCTRKVSSIQSDSICNAMYMFTHHEVGIVSWCSMHVFVGGQLSIVHTPAKSGRHFFDVPFTCQTRRVVQIHMACTSLQWWLCCRLWIWIAEVKPIPIPRHASRVGLQRSGTLPCSGPSILAGIKSFYKPVICTNQGFLQTSYLYEPRVSANQ